MSALTGSRTEANLRQAFATATLAQLRYTAIAEHAESIGDNRTAGLARAMADRRATQAEAHLARLEPCDGDTSTLYNVRLLTMDEMSATADAYPAMARTAREEGFPEIAGWFEVRAKAGRSRAGRFRRVLETQF